MTTQTFLPDFAKPVGVYNETWYEDAGDEYILHPVEYAVTAARIEFLKSPFAMKDDVKSMKGARWHGFDAQNPRKIWSAHNDPRNWFQVARLENHDPYGWFDKIKLPDPDDYLPDTKAYFDATFKMVHDQVGDQYDFQPMKSKVDGRVINLKDHQKLFVYMLDQLHYHIIAGEMGTGKTLAAQKAIELSGHDNWLWVGPLKVLDGTKMEFDEWSFPWDKINIEFWNYEKLRNFDPRNHDFAGVVFDECTALKNFGSDQSEGAFRLTEQIREKYGYDGYVIPMSGTPAPKSPIDWWGICEQTYPGFLKEGSERAFVRRMCFETQKEIKGGEQIVNQKNGFRENPLMCDKCGEEASHPNHGKGRGKHLWTESENEVYALNHRLSGLRTVVFKKDVLSELPDKIFKVDQAKPSTSVLRAAKVILNSSDSVIGAMTEIRMLSDGFAYRMEASGMKKCDNCKDGTTLVYQDKNNEDRQFEDLDFVPDGYDVEEKTVDCPKCNGSCKIPKKKRVTKEVPTPKESMLVTRLSQCEDTGRIGIFAGFKGSLDRVKKICHKRGWSVIRCDGDGWEVSTPSEVLWREREGANSLKFWKDTKENDMVAFVAHPKSGGKGLTLIESNMCVFWSNDFNPESRWQAIDRFHRMGQNRGVYIVDLEHLPTDGQIRRVLEENRKLEKMTLGDFKL